MTVQEIIKILERNDWYIVRMKGSHRQLKHKKKKGLVTVSGKQSDDLAPGTLNNILRLSS